jgi:hypothetical protein
MRELEANFAAKFNERGEMMGFLSFLKKAGQVLANVAAEEAGLEPIFKKLLPAAAGPVLDKLDLAFKNIVATEGMFTKAFPGQQTGPQKLTAATTLIEPLLASVDTLVGTHIVDGPASAAAVLKITSGLADYINARSGGDSTGTSVAALPAPAASISSTPATPAA